MITPPPDARDICGRGFIVAPGESRFCHRDKGHAADHESIYRGAPLSWPAVVPV